MRATLLVVEGRSGTYRVPAECDDAEVLCRFSENGREWWALEHQGVLILAKAIGVELPVAGRVIEPDLRLDDPLWVSPDLATVDIGHECWIARGRRFYICRRPGWRPRLLDEHQAGQFMLSYILQERPDLVSNPIIRQLVDELPEWAVESDDDESDESDDEYIAACLTA